MDVLQIIESLDSLWFFSNIFSSTSQPLASASDDENTPKGIPKSEPSKPMTPVLQDHQNQSPNAEIMVQKCLQCSDLVVETEEPHVVQPVAMEVLESPKPPEEEERRRARSKRSFKPCLDQRRKILRELDLGVDVNKVTCGYQRFGSSQHHIKMPPFNDGMAMKEHLKSWAYAVACTVR